MSNITGKKLLKVLKEDYVVEASESSIDVKIFKGLVNRIEVDLKTLKGLARTEFKRLDQIDNDLDKEYRAWREDLPEAPMRRPAGEDVWNKKTTASQNKLDDIEEVEGEIDNVLDQLSGLKDSVKLLR